MRYGTAARGPVLKKAKALSVFKGFALQLYIASAGGWGNVQTTVITLRSIARRHKRIDVTCDGVSIREGSEPQKLLVEMQLFCKKRRSTTLILSTMAV